MDASISFSTNVPFETTRLLSPSSTVLSPTGTLAEKLGNVKKEKKKEKRLE